MFSVLMVVSLIDDSRLCIHVLIILMRNEIQIVLYTNVTGTNKITESCLSCFPALIK